MNSTLLVIFGSLHFIYFLIYAGMYSSVMQNLNEYQAKIKNSRIKNERFEFEIRQLEPVIITLRKVWFLPSVLIGSLHGIGLLLSEMGTRFDYLMAVLLLAIFLLLNLLVRWMKGAGTIDSNQRMGKSPLM